MSQLAFGINISATDNTQSALSRAAGGISSLARFAAKPITIPFKVAQSGLGFLRDVQLGLRPLLAGIEGLVDRGARLGTIEKTFSALTKTVGDDTQQMAQSLVDASNGTLTLQRAMELANDSMERGVNVTRELPTILDFASKKAIATGVSFDSAAEQIVKGISRQSTALLENFGLMRGGTEGIAEAFDKIHGEGAFAVLAPAAKRAEFIRQAMEQIRASMGRMGLHGKEVAFTYAAAKSRLSDMVDKLAAAIAGSEAFSEAMKGVESILSGITQHFERGGSFFEIMFGKGDSLGLMGIFAGVFEDIADMMADKLFEALRKVPSILAKAMGALLSGGGGGDDAGDGPGAGGDGLFRRIIGLWQRGNDEMFGGVDAGGGGSFLSRVPSLWRRGMDDMYGPSAPPFFGAGFGMGLGFPNAPPAPPDRNGYFSITRARIRAFERVFGNPDVDAQGRAIPPTIIDRMREAPLTERGEAMRRGERTLLEREIRKQEAHAARDAKRQVASLVREARRKGIDLDFEFTEQQTREALIGERTAKQRRRIEEINAEIERTEEIKRRRDAANTKLRGADQDAIRENAEQGKLLVSAWNAAFKDSLDGSARRIESLITELISAGNGILSVLGVGERELAVIGGRRN